MAPDPPPDLARSGPRSARRPVAIHFRSRLVHQPDQWTGGRREGRSRTARWCLGPRGGPVDRGRARPTRAARFYRPNGPCAGPPDQRRAM